MILLDLFLSTPVVLFSWAIMIKVCGVQHITRPTILGVGYLTFFGMHFLPAAIFLFDPTMSKARLYFWACTTALLMYSIGGLLVSGMFRFRPGRIQRYYADLASTPPTSKDLVFFVVLSLFCLTAFLIFLIDVPVYPLYLLLTGQIGSYQANLMRRLVYGPEMGSPLWYLYGVMLRYWMPFLLVLVAALWRYLTGLFLKVFATGLGLMVFTYNSWSGAKTPVATLFFLILILLMLKSSGQYITSVRQNIHRFSKRRKFTMYLAILLMLFLGLGYIVFNFRVRSFGGNDASLWFILYYGIGRRIFFGPAYLSYLQFEMFPEMYDFTYFRDIAKLASLLGQEFIPLSTLTAIFISGDPNTPTHSPPATIGNFYAQAGWPMVVFGYLALGFLLQGIQILIMSYLPKSPVVPAIITVLSFGAFRLNMTSFHQFLLSEAVVPTLIVTMLWLFIRQLTFQPRPDYIATARQR